MLLSWLLNHLRQRQRQRLSHLLLFFSFHFAPNLPQNRYSPNLQTILTSCCWVKSQNSFRMLARDHSMFEGAHCHNLGWCHLTITERANFEVFNTDIFVTNNNYEVQPIYIGVFFFLFCRDVVLMLPWLQWLTTPRVQKDIPTITMLVLNPFLKQSGVSHSLRNILHLDPNIYFLLFGSGRCYSKACNWNRRDVEKGRNSSSKFVKHSRSIFFYTLVMASLVISIGYNWSVPTSICFFRLVRRTHCERSLVLLEGIPHC